MNYVIIGKINDHIKKLVFSILLFSIFSCDKNVEDRTYIIVIENNLAEIVEIKSYNSITKEFIKTISINTNDNFVGQFESDDRNGPVGANGVFQGDSVAIQIGMTSDIISYKCNLSLPDNENGCNKDGNILNDFDPKWKQERSENVFTNTYTFE